MSPMPPVGLTAAGCASRALRHLCVAPGHGLVMVAILWLAWPQSLIGLALALTTAIAGSLRWQHLNSSPGRWTRYAICWHAVRHARRQWPEICAATGLTSTSPDGTQHPAIASATAKWPHLTLRVRPLLGQTVEDFEQTAEAVRMGLDASRVRIEPVGTRELLLTLTIGDPLAAPFDALAGDEEATDRVTVGIREDGKPWQMRVGPHTLIAGSSGAGKGSVFWSFAFALAPRIRHGDVRLHGIDLKGGMEILMGEALFASVATSTGEAVALLEYLVEQMQGRTKEYAGKVRGHLATLDQPLEVVMIDELAVLTAYCSDRDLQRRADAAINMLCSQGRAPGYVVLACLQDPRKEVIPSRGLFTQMIGLRLKDLSETSMVLGEVALESGALCHRIPWELPGVAYVTADDLRHPMRVRAGYASDEAIRDVAARFAAPQRIDLPPLRDSLERRRTSARTSEQAL